jgi:hypothetical protein
MEWIENTKAFDRLLKNLNTLETKEVKVGFFDKYYGPDNDNLPVAQVAQWQEEGTPNGIPARPMFRVHLHNKIMTSYKAPIGRSIKDIAEGRSTITKVLKLLGEGLELDLKGIISEGVPPPNSPAWSAKKGGLPPLTFTGHMQDSVSYKITTKGKDD